MPSGASITTQRNGVVKIAAPKLDRYSPLRSITPDAGSVVTASPAIAQAASAVISMPTDMVP